MIKIFRETARYLLVLLSSIRQARATHGAEAFDDTLVRAIGAWTNSHPDDPLSTELQKSSWQDTIYGFPYDEVIEAIRGSLEASSSKEGDLPLINTIVEILGLPFASNYLSGDAVASLRRAILTPGELEGFRKKSKEAFSCSSCGHKFMPYELGVIRRESDGAPGLLCVNCAEPHYSSCPSCRESAHLSATGSLMLKSSKMVSCDCRSKKEKVVLVPASPQRETPDTPRIPTPRGAIQGNPTTTGWVRNAFIDEIATAPPAPTAALRSRAQVRATFSQLLRDEAAAFANLRTTELRQSELLGLDSTVQRSGLTPFNDEGDDE